MLDRKCPQGQPNKSKAFKVVEPEAMWETVVALDASGVLRIVRIADDALWFLNLETGEFICYDGMNQETFVAPLPNAAPVGARFLNETDILVADKNYGLCKFIPGTNSYYVVADKCGDEPFQSVSSITMDGYGGAYVTDVCDSSYFKRSGRVYYVWFRDGGFDVEFFSDGAAFPCCTALSEEDDLFIGEFGTNTVVCVPSKAAQGRVEVPSLFMYHDDGHGPTGLAVDSSNNLYAAFEFCHDILVSSHNGSRKTVIPLPECAKDFAADIVIDGNFLYVLEGTEGVLYRIKLTPQPNEEPYFDIFSACGYGSECSQDCIAFTMRGSSFDDLL